LFKTDQNLTACFFSLCWYNQSQS